MPILTLLEAHRFLRDAKLSPLAVSDDRSQKLQQAMGLRRVKAVAASANLLHWSFDIWFVTGALVAFVFAFLAQFFAGNATSVLVPLAAATLAGVSYVGMTVLGCVLLRAQDAIQLLSETRGLECKTALELVQSCPPAAALHAQLLAAAVPLRMFHYDAFRRLYEAMREAEWSASNRVETDKESLERRHACRHLHGILDADTAPTP